MTTGPPARDINRRLLALPGVQSVGITTDLPVQCNCDTDWIRIVGKPYNGTHNEVNQRDVSPAYAAALTASFPPARRAASVNPTDALRAE